MRLLHTYKTVRIKCINIGKTSQCAGSELSKEIQQTTARKQNQFKNK